MVTDARLDAVYCVTIYEDGNISVHIALGWCSPLLQGILYHISTVLASPVSSKTSLVESAEILCTVIQIQCCFFIYETVTMLMQHLTQFP